MASSPTGYDPDTSASIPLLSPPFRYPAVASKEIPEWFAQLPILPLPAHLASLKVEMPPPHLTYSLGFTCAAAGDNKKT